MILARVVGTVVATRRTSASWARSSCFVRTIDPHGKDEAGYLVTVDTVDAGFRGSCCARRERLVGPHGLRPEGSPVDAASSGWWTRSRLKD